MCLNGALRFIPFNLICNMTTSRKIKSFDFLTPRQGLRVCVRMLCVLAWCSMLHSFDIQHDTFRQKKNLTV